MPAFVDRALPVGAATPLAAVRQSFVDGLTGDGPESAEPARASSATAALSFARASAVSTSAPSRRDLRAAALSAAVSGSGAISDLPPRLLSSRQDDASPRIPILRRVGAPGFPDSAYCRQTELACGVARIGLSRGQGQLRENQRPGDR